MVKLYCKIISDKEETIMAKNLKKLLSFTIALIMVLSLIPAVSATEATELISEFKQVTGYRVNTQKQLYFHILAGETWK